MPFCSWRSLLKCSYNSTPSALYIYTVRARSANMRWFYWLDLDKKIGSPTTENDRSVSIEIPRILNSQSKSPQRETNLPWTLISTHFPRYNFSCFQEEQISRNIIWQSTPLFRNTFQQHLKRCVIRIWGHMILFQEEIFVMRQFPASCFGPKGNPGCCY